MMSLAVSMSRRLSAFSIEDPRVDVDVGSGGDLGGQLDQIDDSADIIELVTALELFGQGELIDGHAAFIEADHGLEDPAVCGIVKAAWVEDFEGVADGMLFEHHRPQHGLLDLYRLRRHPF